METPVIRGRYWSGRGDSNSRPPAPKAGALPGCATPRQCHSSDHSPETNYTNTVPDTRGAASLAPAKMPHTAMSESAPTGIQCHARRRRPAGNRDEAHEPQRSHHTSQVPRTWFGGIGWNSAERPCRRPRIEYSHSPRMKILAVTSAYERRTTWLYPQARLTLPVG